MSPWLSISLLSTEFINPVTSKLISKSAVRENNCDVVLEPSKKSHPGVFHNVEPPVTVHDTPEVLIGVSPILPVPCIHGLLIGLVYTVYAVGSWAASAKYICNEAE